MVIVLATATFHFNPDPQRLEPVSLILGLIVLIHNF
jgi:hypothetical protein